MPVHDWTRVSAGTFHDFHISWIVELKRALNQELLRQGYYAQSEQDAWNVSSDDLPLQPADDGTATVRRRAIAIREEGGDEIVALLEILSPNDKSRAERLKRFLNKVVWLREAGIHLLVIDLFPPGPFDSRGIHGAIWEQIDAVDAGDITKPLTLAAYSNNAEYAAYVEPIAVGDTLAEMPLFLDEDRYVPMPLESTYMAAFATIPERWQRVLGQ